MDRYRWRTLPEIFETLAALAPDVRGGCCRIYIYVDMGVGVGMYDGVHMLGRPPPPPVPVSFTTRHCWAGLMIHNSKWRWRTPSTSRRPS